ncbi:MAG: alpha/beta hydrolase [Desulfobulbaceae bacterium]|nr:alpha/beta hydrolase [Desulfobulbaceae bacterium]
MVRRSDEECSVTQQLGSFCDAINFTRIEVVSMTSQTDCSLSSRTLRSHDGIPMACDCRGQGEPLLLFIHGWTCRRDYWQPQLAFFEEHHKVAAPDLPGHGNSSAGDRQCWSVTNFGLDIAAAAKESAAERVILIGHSMGGAVALEAARRLGKMVDAVVLVDTFVIDYGGLSAETIQAIAAPFEDDFASAIAALVEQTSTVATPALLKERLVREMSAADPAWALPVWRDLLAWDPKPAFEELQVVIHAVNGALIPDSARERCAPFVQETVIPGAGHFLQMEDPAGFNRVLDGVLARFR